MTVGDLVTLLAAYPPSAKVRLLVMGDDGFPIDVPLENVGTEQQVLSVNPQSGLVIDEEAINAAMRTAVVDWAAKFPGVTRMKIMIAEERASECPPHDDILEFRLYTRFITEWADWVYRGGAGMMPHVARFDVIDDAFSGLLKRLVA